MTLKRKQLLSPLSLLILAIVGFTGYEAIYGLIRMSQFVTKNQTLVESYKYVGGTKKKVYQKLK